MDEAFKWGDTVLICGELPAFAVKVMWKCGDICPEHNDPLWRCEWEYRGEHLEGYFCETVMQRPN